MHMTKVRLVIDDIRLIQTATAMIVSDIESQTEHRRTKKNTYGDGNNSCYFLSLWV